MTGEISDQHELQNAKWATWFCGTSCGMVVSQCVWAGLSVSDVMSLRKASMLVSCLQWTSRMWTLSKWTRRRCPSRHLDESVTAQLRISSSEAPTLAKNSSAKVVLKSRHSRYLILKVPLIAPMARPTTVQTVDLVRFAWDGGARTSAPSQILRTVVAQQVSNAWEWTAIKPW